MRVWYDTEFWERGNQHPIIPISYGFVREDGEELYLIDAQAPITAIANEHPWLRDNVLPHLPVNVWQPAEGNDWYAAWDEEHPDFEHVFDRVDIARLIRALLTSTPDLELWGWYAAYDHVVLAQTFGTMAQMPEGIPWYTNDVKQVVERRRVPVQKTGTEHNALADARWTRLVHEWYEAEMGAAQA